MKSHKAWLLLLLLLSRFSRVRLCATPYTTARQSPHPWDSPGKNTGVGCRFLLQCMKVKSESEVAQSCPALSDPMDCSLPGSSIRGIFQARVLEWGAIAFSLVTVKYPQKSRIQQFCQGSFPQFFGFLKCCLSLLNSIWNVFKVVEESKYLLLMLTVLTDNMQ